MGQKKTRVRDQEYIDIEELFVLLPDLKTSLDEESAFLFVKELYLLSELIYTQTTNEKEIDDS